MMGLDFPQPLNSILLSRSRLAGPQRWARARPVDHPGNYDKLMQDADDHIDTGARDNGLLKLPRGSGTLGSAELASSGYLVFPSSLWLKPDLRPLSPPPGVDVIVSVLHELS